MQTRTKSNRWQWLTTPFFALALILSGCGGNDHDNNNSNTMNQTLSGTAATGEPIAGYVYVTDVSGTEVNNAINDDGSWNVEVTGMTGPFLVRAVPNDTSLSTQYSYAASANIKVNVTPLTTLALYLANDEQDLSALVSGWSSTQINVTDLQTAQAQINANFAAQLQAQSLDSATYDFFTADFDADGSGFDALLDAVHVEFNMSEGGFAVTVGGDAFNFDVAIDISDISIGGSDNGDTDDTTSGDNTDDGDSGNGDSDNGSGSFGTLTFTGTGASLVPNGAESFTYTPDASNSDALTDPTWTMGTGDDVITLDLPRRLGTNTVSMVRITAGTSGNTHSWVVSDNTNGVSGVVVSISGDTLNFTFTDVQAPEFATGSSELTINGTLTMNLNPSQNETPPDLGDLSLASEGDADVDGTTFSPTTVTKTTSSFLFSSTKVDLKWVFSPQTGELHVLTASQVTGSTIADYNVTNITYKRYLNGGIDPEPTTYSGGVTNDKVVIGSNDATFTGANITGGQYPNFITVTLDGTLTVPAEDGTLQ
jgi:hypothetical protein